MGEPLITPELQARYDSIIRQQTGVSDYRNDGFVNFVTKYGTYSDANEHYFFMPEADVSDDTLTRFYEGNGLFAKIIDVPAEEAMKHGFTLGDLADAEIIDYYQKICEDLDLEESMTIGMRWARLFGGSIGVMLIDDGRGIDEPLDWKHIKSVDGIRVFERAIVQPDYQSMFRYQHKDPYRARRKVIGSPEYYYVTSKYGYFAVHESRTLPFLNGTLPENTSNSVYQIWGLPEYIRLHRAIRDAETAHGSANKLLDRSVQAVYKMKNLSEELATEQGEERVLKRLRTIDMARGLLNSITIDAEGEEYDFRQFTFTGVSDVIDCTCNFVSALTNIPQTILFGRSPAGMNSTGESDNESWYSFVERIQKRMLKGNLRYLTSIIFAAGINSGKLKEFPSFEIEFNPLWTQSEAEKADLDLKKAQTAQTRAATAMTYIQNDVVTPEEVRKNLADSDEFDVETMLDDIPEDELMSEDIMNDMMNAQQPGNGQMPPGNAPGGINPQQPAENPAIGQGQAQAADSDVDASYEDIVNMETAKRVNESMAAEEEPETNEDSEADVEQAYEDVVNHETAIRVNESLDYSMEFDEDPDTESPVDAENFGVGILVIKDGKILLGERLQGNQPGTLCGPGGHIHVGETPLQAAIRESDEEFGIIPTDLMYIGSLKNERGKSYQFLCTDYEGEITAKDGEMGSPRFVDPQWLMENQDKLFSPFAQAAGMTFYKIGAADNNPFNTDGDEPDGWIAEDGNRTSADSDDNLVEGQPEAVEQRLGEGIDSRLDGGPGSGNFGHGGRPGEIGGSAPNDSSGSANTEENAPKHLTNKGERDTIQSQKSTNPGPVVKINSSELREALKSGKISTKLRMSRQNRHIKGTPEYEAASKTRNVGYITITPEEVREIIEKYAGRGAAYGNGVQFKETIDVGKVIGVHVSRAGKESETTRCTIHYGEKGAHIVPAAPARY